MGIIIYLLIMAGWMTLMARFILKMENLSSIVSDLTFSINDSENGGNENAHNTSYNLINCNDSTVLELITLT